MEDNKNVSIGKAVDSIKELNGETITNGDILVADNELAEGYKIPTSVKTPVSYLDDLRKYNDIYNDIYKQIEVCNKLYKYNSIVGNAVDILIDFAVTPVRPMPTGNDELDKILEYWFKNVNENNTNSSPGVYPLTQELGLEWFTSGNAFPYTKWENIKVDKATYKLPFNINLINPQSIHIPSGPIAFGQEVIYLKWDADLLDKIKMDGRGNPEVALIKAAIPRSMLNAINDSKMHEGIRLNPKYISHLKRRAKGYQAWGVPYLTRCFSCVSILERLRELDESITTGIINLITIFKIGTEEHPASNARLKKFAGLLTNSKASQTLVWAHDIEVIQVGPDGKVLAFKDKYKDAKEDVLVALGIPPFLMSLNFTGDEWVSLLSLVERLTHWRNTVSLWLEKTCRKIAEENELEGNIAIKWDRMNLTDEKAIKNLVLSFYDRGLISIKTALSESGYDIEREKVSKKEEKDIQEDFMPPMLPFSGTGQEPKDGRPTDESKKTTVNKPKKIEQTVNMKFQKKPNKPAKGEDNE